MLDWILGGFKRQEVGALFYDTMITTTHNMSFLHLAEGFIVGLPFYDGVAGGNFLYEISRALFISLYWAFRVGYTRMAGRGLGNRVRSEGETKKTGGNGG